MAMGLLLPPLWQLRLILILFLCRFNVWLQGGKFYVHDLCSTFHFKEWIWLEGKLLKINLLYANDNSINSITRRSLKNAVFKNKNENLILLTYTIKNAK